MDVAIYKRFKSDMDVAFNSADRELVCPFVPFRYVALSLTRTRRAPAPQFRSQLDQVCHHGD